MIYELPTEASQPASTLHFTHQLGLSGAWECATPWRAIHAAGIQTSMSASSSVPDAAVALEASAASMMSTAVNGAFRTLRWRSPGVLQECLREESPGVTVASLARKASRWGLTNGWSGRVSIVSSGREATIRGADGFSYITHGT